MIVTPYFKDCGQLSCKPSCIGQCFKTCSKCSEVKVLTMKPDGFMRKFHSIKKFKYTYNIFSKKDFMLVKKQRVVHNPEQRIIEIPNLPVDLLNVGMVNPNALPPEQHKVIINLPVCIACIHLDKLHRIRWLSYWEKVIRSPTLPSVEVVLEHLWEFKRNRRTIERLLTFIDCIPLRFQHEAMRDALSTLFAQAYDWKSNK